MYLSNRDVRPTGLEPGEFLDSPPIPEEAVDAVSAPTDVEPGPDYRSSSPPARS
jgi:hypothetical protein